MRIYEKHPSADAYRVGASYTPYAIVAKDKRFTDAELAAEYHQIEKEAWCLVAKESISKERDRELSERVDEMSATTLRFAALPHYDEDPQ